MALLRVEGLGMPAGGSVLLTAVVGCSGAAAALTGVMMTGPVTTRLMVGVCRGEGRGV